MHFLKTMRRRARSPGADGSGVGVDGKWKVEQPGRPAILPSIMKRKRKWWVWLTGVGFVILVVWTLAVILRDDRLMFARPFPIPNRVMSLGVQGWAVEPVSGANYRIGPDGTVIADGSDLPAKTAVQQLIDGFGWLLLKPLPDKTTGRTVDHMVCLTPDLTERWQVPVSGYPFLVSLSADGSVVFFDDEGFLKVIGLDGSLRLKKLVGWMPGHKPPAVEGNVVLSGNPEYALLVLQSLDGDVLWKRFAPGGAAHNFLALDSHTNAIVASSTNLVKLDALGTPVWTNNLPMVQPGFWPTNSPFAPSAAVGIFTDRHANVYCKVHAGYLHAYSSGGRLLWTRHVGNQAQATVAPNGNLVIVCSDDWSGYGSPWGPGTRQATVELMTAASGTRVICLAPSGELIWEQKLPGDFQLRMPGDRYDLQMMWRQARGFHESRRLSKPVVTADGIVLLTGFHGTNSWIYAIRGDRPLK